MLIQGDCLEELKKLDDNSIDAVITDPPYGLSFMGKKWDYDVPSQEIWEECLRVLKPGGYLLSFAGTRTQHRMAVRIEDAGFEIRDMIAWVYGSGFPKSLNIGKAVDKINGEIGRLIKFVEWYRTTGMKQKETNEIIGKSDVGSHYLRLDQPAIPTRELWNKLRPHIKIEIPQWVDELVERIEKEREIVGLQQNAMSGWNMDGTTQFKNRAITKGNSEWEGWGTALKPALEPITLARKPIEGTVAENCLKWGTGGIQIDECRIGTEERKNAQKDFTAIHGNQYSNGAYQPTTGSVTVSGRFPANLIHDGSDEVVELFPNTKSGIKNGKHDGFGRNGIYGRAGAVETYTWGDSGSAARFFKEVPPDKKSMWFNHREADGTGVPQGPTYLDKGSAARFFYCAKSSKSERNMGCEELEEKRGGSMEANTTDTMQLGGASLKGEPKEIQKTKNNHPTVKPIALMQYLIKLVSREGSTVLDPFMGSGTTGIACKKLNREFIGIEKDPEYFKIAQARIKSVPTNLFNNFEQNV